MTAPGPRAEESPAPPPPGERTRRPPPLRRLARWSLAAATLGLLGLVALALVRSRLVDPTATFVLLDRHGEYLGETRGDRDDATGYWPVDPLPPRVVAAVLALEDRRFRSHPGVDPFAVVRALRQNVAAGRRVSGASTIAMQVARMQDPGRRGLPRKALEAMTAVALTARHGRDAVLAQYLRLVPYGNRVHGIGAAARRYLDKPVEDLSWAEVAFLSAIPQAPGRRNPHEPEGRWSAIRRGRRILRTLRADGLLSLDDFRLATRQIAELSVPPPARRPDEAMHAILALEERLAAPELARLFRSRPVVPTTLDLALQRDLAARVARAVDEREARGAGSGALVAVRLGPRPELLAWVGSTGFFDAARAGAIDFCRVPRSPGSTLKPFLYAFALDAGALSPETVLDDLERGPGSIGNADDRFLGPMLPRAALGNSRNVPAALVLERLGLEEGYARLRDAALHDGSRPARQYGLGLALGGMPVTLERLVTASAALAGSGELAGLRWIRNEPLPDPRRLVSEETARLVSLWLSDPSARLPSFPRMGATEFPFPVAVKTGTSSRVRDAWCVAWSREFLVGAWIGHPDATPMNRQTGFLAAAELARDALLRLHRDAGEPPDAGFPPPAGWRPARLCPTTGSLAGEACDRVVTEWFRAGTEPVDTCAAHRRVAVDRRTGLLATTATPRRDVEVRIVLELPPRYAAWLAESGQAPPGEDFGAPTDRDRAPRLSVTSPRAGSRLFRDPETPAGLATLALRVSADPPVPQLVWWVDGRPFATVAPPYSARWPLEPGEHTFEARLPWGGIRSGAIRVVVE